MSAEVAAAGEIDRNEYYDNYIGQTLEHLQVVHRTLTQQRPNIMWLAGDSSFDNKFWREVKSSSAPAINGYERVLSGNMKRDMCYAVNAEIRSQGLASWACINTAVEESSLNLRSAGRLTEQDEFLRDHLQPDDTILVSVGGNGMCVHGACNMCALDLFARGLCAYHGVDWSYMIALFPVRAHHMN
jgi:hypothetical protein